MRALLVLSILSYPIWVGGIGRQASTITLSPQLAITTSSGSTATQRSPPAALLNDTENILTGDVNVKINVNVDINVNANGT